MYKIKKSRRLHNCHNRKHGNPKYGAGVCREIVRQAVVVRIAGKRLCRHWLRSLSLDDEEV